jgi:hypothetical protein
MSVKVSINKLNDAMNAMRRPGSRMIQTNYQGRPDFWITPSGGRVDPDIAKKIIAHPRVIGGRDALFPGHHQTWQMRPADDMGRCDDNAQKQDSGVGSLKFALDVYRWPNAGGAESLRNCSTSLHDIEDGSLPEQFTGNKRNDIN